MTQEVQVIEIPGASSCPETLQIRQKVGSNPIIKDVSKSKEPSLTLSTINPLILTFKAMEYAARGPVILKTLEIERELISQKNSNSSPNSGRREFNGVVKANLGDAHAMGQKPITFLRQVLSGIACPELMDSSSAVPRDVKQRVKTLLHQCRGESIGAYTDSRGLEIVRRHVAEYITRRDDGVKSDSDNVFLSAGASDGIRACLKLLKSGPGMKKSGVLIPIPEYPLYNATLGEYDIEQIGYYLDEQNNWSVNVKALEKIVESSRTHCDPRAVVIINPGNPTGHILSRENMKEIIKFAYRENLVIFADEVYQDNVYGDAKFLSFKRIIMEMGSPYASSIELFSFYSCSKGYICECGVRGAYCETVNINPDVRSVLHASIAAKLCPTVFGQAAVECAVNPPEEGDESYGLFLQEKSNILRSLEEKAKLVEKTFNSLPGMSCSEIQGAMYAFPQITLPEKAIQVSKSQGMEPDVFYCLELVEETGICVVPGSGMGQLPGTYHFRTTLLPSMEHLTLMLSKFTQFHSKFLKKYSTDSDSSCSDSGSENEMAR